MRVHRSIEDADFVMQVLSGAASALTYVADRVATVDQLTGAHGKAGEMSVQRGNAVAMVNQDRPSVAVHEIREAYDSVCRSQDAGAVVTGNIHAAMESAFTAERVNAFTKRSGNASGYRPKGRRCRQAHP